MNSAQFAESERPGKIISEKQTEKIIYFPAGKPFAAPVKAFYYPHWQASANGEKIEVKKSENGVILLDIPAEETIVKLEFIEPWYVKTAKYISAFFWLLMLGFGGYFTFAETYLKTKKVAY